MADSKTLKDKIDKNVFTIIEGSLTTGVFVTSTLVSYYLDEKVITGLASIGGLIAVGYTYNYGIKPLYKTLNDLFE